ncbi:MAG: type II secretion system F family protein, partial [Janthinobacterium lividum]
MAQFQYRAVSPAGAMTTGLLDAPDHEQALLRVRQLGVVPVEVAVARAGARPAAAKAGATARRAVTKTIGELAVLLNAGLSLDRALGLAIENIDHAPARTEFLDLLDRVKEGVPLSRAMARRGDLFPPMAQAMVEAGEANGRLGDALERLAATLERAEDLHALMVSSMIYPAALLVIAVGVILLMLLFVVPQFESVFATAPGGTLPAASLAVMAASRGLRAYGWILLGALVAAGLVARQLL